MNFDHRPTFTLYCKHSQTSVLLPKKSTKFAETFSKAILNASQVLQEIV